MLTKQQKAEEDAALKAAKLKLQNANKNAIPSTSNISNQGEVHQLNK